MGGLEGGSVPAGCNATDDPPSSEEKKRAFAENGGTAAETRVGERREAEERTQRNEAPFESFAGAGC